MSERPTVETKAEMPPVCICGHDSEWHDWGDEFDYLEGECQHADCACVKFKEAPGWWTEPTHEACRRVLKRSAELMAELGDDDVTGVFDLEYAKALDAMRDLMHDDKERAEAALEAAKARRERGL